MDQRDEHQPKVAAGGGTEPAPDPESTATPAPSGAPAHDLKTDHLPDPED